MGAACTSTDTSSDTAATSTAETATTTDATAGATGGGTTGTTAGGTTASAGTGSGTMATGTSANAGDDVMTMADMTDPMFLMDAASSNMLEIQLGKMAAQQATHPEVKKFGQMMQDHHTKATQELKTVASQLKVQMPTTLMPVHQELVDKVQGKSGAEFDEAYMDAMETAHRLDIAKFEMKSNSAENATVKAFAAKTLPMLQSHMKMAKELEDKVD